MKKKLLSIGIVIALVSLLFYGLYELMSSRSFQLFGGLTAQVETEEKVVALTFDDGPTKNIDSILPLLDKYDVKATFFLIGEEIEKHPEETNKIIEAGHQIGNHTYSHKRMVLKSPSFVKEEIEKTDLLIQDAGYTSEIDFRPPYGKKLVILPYYLNKQSKETIMWDIEPDSYFSEAADKVKYVTENTKPGSIILLHPMYDDLDNTLLTIEGVLKALLDEGYSFVTVNELQGF